MARSQEKSNMSTAHEQRQQLSHVVIQPSLPHAVITGDLRFAVTESDAARGPISGNYRIETREMQESFWVLWGTEGQVQSRHARVTEIIFALAGARVGQMWIYQVQAQVTDRRTSIVTGVFVQILVIPDLLH
jgi:hypothetical protein